MQEIDLTTVSSPDENPWYTTCYLPALHARAKDVFADPEFSYGFLVGLEAYEEHAADHDGTLPFQYVVQAVTMELNPLQLAREANFDRANGSTPSSPAYRTGFLAGFAYAYYVGPVEVPDVQPQPESEPATEKVGVILPFRARTPRDGKLL